MSTSIRRWPERALRKAIVLITCVFVLLFSVDNAFSQSSGSAGFDLLPRAGAEIPFGPVTDSGDDVYSVGFSTGVLADYHLPSSSKLSLAGSLFYHSFPTAADDRLSVVTLGAGPGIRFNPLPFMDIRSGITAGIYLGMREDDVGLNPYADADTSLEFSLSPGFHLNIGANYTYYFTSYEGSVTDLYNGMGLHAGATIALGAGSRRSRVEFREIRFDPVFPVFYTYYDNHPLGNAVIRNGEDTTITDVRVSFFVKRYMDKPKLCTLIDSLKPGEEAQAPLYALFTDDVMNITEATMATAEIIVEYNLKGDEKDGETSESMRLLDRNAMTWDDDRKAASFITAKDPMVLQFSKNVAGAIREEDRMAVNYNFRNALALFEALSLYGISYVIDPKTPYESFSANKFATDYLQFPQQSLIYKAGDCDDLSILYASLLEAVGIETAFITVPGHIFTAFSLGVPPSEAKRIFQYEDELIFQDENTWIPVEITLLGTDFLNAWRTGAQEWREAEKTAEARLYPIHEAWKLYKPTGIKAAGSSIAIPEEAEILDIYTVQLDQFIRREIQTRIAALEDSIRRSGNDPKYINKLGTLYARFGMHDEAESQFRQITKGSRPYVPALINLGNICYLRDDLDGAMDYFQKAADRDAKSAAAYIGLAKINYELGQHAEVEQYCAKAEQINPAYLDKFSYLINRKISGSARASSALYKEVLPWEDE